MSYPDNRLSSPCLPLPDASFASFFPTSLPHFPHSPTPSATISQSTEPSSIASSPRDSLPATRKNTRKARSTSNQKTLKRVKKSIHPRHSQRDHEKTCPQCKSVCSSKGSMVRHDTHSCIGKKLVHECDACGLPYSRLDALKRHQKRCHKKKDQENAHRQPELFSKFPPPLPLLSQGLPASSLPVAPIPPDVPGPSHTFQAVAPSTITDLLALYHKCPPSDYAHGVSLPQTESAAYWQWPAGHGQVDVPGVNGLAPFEMAPPPSVYSFGALPDPTYDTAIQMMFQPYDTDNIANQWDPLSFSDEESINAFQALASGVQNCNNLESP